MHFQHLALRVNNPDKRYNPSVIQAPDLQSRYFYVYDPNGVSVQLKFKKR